MESEPLLNTAGNLYFCTLYYWARTFKCLWGPGIDAKELIPPDYVGKPIPPRCLSPIDFLKIPALCIEGGDRIPVSKYKYKGFDSTRWNKRGDKAYHVGVTSKASQRLLLLNSVTATVRLTNNSVKTISRIFVYLIREIDKQLAWRIFSRSLQWDEYVYN